MNQTGCIILAGGKSSRMGHDKGFLKLDGKHMFEHVVDAVKGITANPLIIANHSPYYRLNYKVYPDIINDRGPLGGIFTGLFHTPYEKNLVLSCDTPLLSSAWLKYLLQHASDGKITISGCLGKLHPLVGVYPKSMLHEIGAALKSNNLKMMDFVKKHKAVVMEVADADEDIKAESFANFNTAAEIYTAIPGVKLSFELNEKLKK